MTLVTPEEAAKILGLTRGRAIKSLAAKGIDKFLPPNQEKPFRYCLSEVLWLKEKRESLKVLRELKRNQK